MGRKSDPTRLWTIQDALETYGVPYWGRGYFGIGENGHALVHPHQDTRQAIGENRSAGIITQAITVNLPTTPQLDDLYGPMRHTVISDVRELPDKLLRLYGALTRA